MVLKDLVMQNYKMNNIEIRKYKEDFKDEWDNFISKAKNSHFFFNRDYMDYNSNRFKDFSLLCYFKNNLIALLPANVADNTIYSYGGLTFGGLITNERMTASLMLGLFQDILKYYSKEGLTIIIYKPVPYIYHKIPAQEDLYALFTQNAKLIRRDVSSIIDLQENIHYTKGRKWSINKAKKNSIEVKRCERYNDFMKMLQKVLKERHNLKPTHSLEEIKLLAARFPQNIKLFCAFRNEEMLAGTVIFENNFTVHTQYMSSNEKGRELGKLKDGAAWLALVTGARILPIWVEGTDKVLPNNKYPLPRLWHRVTIKIGNPVSIQGNTRKEATSEISQALLELADE